MADFLPFFQSRLSICIKSIIVILLSMMAVSYSSVFSLAILDLGRQIEESKFPRTI